MAFVERAALPALRAAPLSQLKSGGRTAVRGSGYDMNLFAATPTDFAGFIAEGPMFWTLIALLD